MFPFDEAATWSKIERASRIAPSDFCAMMFSPAGSAEYPSQSATYWSCSAMSATVILWKSYFWHRERIVGKILFFSVVARMKMTYSGGSSRVLRNALNAAGESMWTSSMMKTRYFPVIGGTSTWLVISRMSSTELFEAASISMMLSERCSLKARQDSHSLQGSPSGVRCSQLMAFAKIRAVVVLPTPRCPQKR